MSRRTDPPQRRYGATPWSRAVLDVLDRPGDARRVNKARSYFRERKVHDLRIRPGHVTALVQGSQLEPFATSLRSRPAEPDLVVALLREKGATDDLVAVGRGEQPRTLGSTVLPTEPGDMISECTCPDDEPRCVHVLAVAYEIAAQIDANASTALTVMGAPLTSLLAAMRSRDTTLEGADASSAGHTDTDMTPLTVGRHAPGVLPALPTPPAIDVIADLDESTLARALRASGVRAADIAEATDELADLYARIRRGGRSSRTSSGVTPAREG